MLKELFTKIFGKKVKDERVTALNRRIAGEGFYILFFGLVTIIAVRIFVLEEGFSSWGAEWVLFMISAFYVVIRSVMLALPLSTRKMKINVKILAALLAAVVYWAGSLGLGLLAGPIAPTILVIHLLAGLFAALIAFLILLLVEKLVARRSKELSGE